MVSVEVRVARPPGHGGDGGDEPDQHREDGQREGELVDAEEVFDVVGGDPTEVMDELHLAGGGGELAPGDEAQREAEAARDQGEDARALVHLFLVEQARAAQAEEAQDTGPAEQGQERDPREQGAGGRLGGDGGAPYRITYGRRTKAMAPASAPKR